MKRFGFLSVLLVASVTAAGGDLAAAEDAGSAPTQGRADSNLTIMSSCSDLREATEGLTAGEARTLELSVVGPLTMAQFDGTLAYLAVCEAPDPQVLCVAYGTNGFAPGDIVVLSGGLGGYERPDADHILLDPCLPSPPDK